MVIEKVDPGDQTILEGKDSVKEGWRWFCGKSKHEDLSSNHRSYGNNCTPMHIMEADKRISGGFVDGSLAAPDVRETLS